MELHLSVELDTRAQDALSPMTLSKEHDSWSSWCFLDGGIGAATGPSDGAACHDFAQPLRLAAVGRWERCSMVDAECNQSFLVYTANRLKSLCGHRCTLAETQHVLNRDVGGGR